MEENLKYIIDNWRQVNVELETIRLDQIRSYETERNNRDLRENIEKYWEQKDYRGLIEALETYEEELEGSIKKKYDFAKKMIR